MKYLLLLLSIMLYTFVASQTKPLLNTDIFNDEIVINIEYIFSSNFQRDTLNSDNDTSEYLNYKIKIEPIKRKLLKVTIFDFESKILVSNIDTLNLLYGEYLKLLEFSFKTDLKFRKTKLLNKKSIRKLAWKYGLTIYEIKNNMMSYSDENMAYHKNITTPFRRKDIKSRCKFLFGSALGGYQIDFSKDYEYPYIVELPSFNTSYFDTLFYECTPVSNEISYMDVYYKTHYSDIKEMLLDANVSDFEGFSIKSSKYYINVESKKLLKVIYSNIGESNEYKSRSVFEFKLNYGG